MKRSFAALLVVFLAVGSASAMACSSDKGKMLDGAVDSGQTSVPGTKT